MSRLSEDQKQRYSRQILLPQFGGKAQKSLLESRVFVVGAGGLGSPVIQYLAAAGVGTIEVIDADPVDLSNLHRQVLHGTDSIGMPKVESARLYVQRLNPEVNLIAHHEWLTVDNIMERFAAADVIVDGSDNFPTRFLVNDACHFLRKPLVSGALLQFEGQVTVFPHDGGADSPCYRCLFPEIPPPGLIPTCREAGIIGPVAGIIGTIQANEVIKLLTGIGDPLIGRLQILDALTMRWREIKLHRDEECPLNGNHPKIHGVIAYEGAPCNLR